MADPLSFVKSYFLVVFFWILLLYAVCGVNKEGFFTDITREFRFFKKNAVLGRWT